VGYCFPSGLEKTFCKWDIYVPLVAEGLKALIDISLTGVRIVMNCNYIQYRMEFRIWSHRSVNRNTKLYGIYSGW
jgi:hypothetical protein